MLLERSADSGGTASVPGFDAAAEESCVRRGAVEADVRMIPRLWTPKTARNSGNLRLVARRRLAGVAPGTDRRHHLALGFRADASSRGRGGGSASAGLPSFGSGSCPDSSVRSESDRELSFCLDLRYAVNSS